MSTAPRETVVVVHGTFARPGEEKKIVSWFALGGAFCRKLDKALEHLGSAARCWAHLQCPPTEVPKTPFSWSGLNSWSARQEAARELKAYIQDLVTSGWRVHLVAHSHGGNVAIDATDFMSARGCGWIGGKLVFYGTPLLFNDYHHHANTFVHVASRIIGIPLLWTGLLIAVLWTNWDYLWSSSYFFSTDNLVSVAVASALIWILFHVWEAGNRSSVPAWIPNLTRGQILSPSAFSSSTVARMKLISC